MRTLKLIQRQDKSTQHSVSSLLASPVDDASVPGLVTSPSQEVMAQEEDASITVIRQAAQEGLQTPSTELPYAEQIQKSFGRHDISRIQAHLGSKATATAEAMNALAYTAGEHVVFAGTPTLYIVAHEVAHVVQQRGQVLLADGIGKMGDVYEQHANAVADRVVAGQSAEDLLDCLAGKQNEAHAGLPCADGKNPSSLPVVHSSVAMSPMMNFLKPRWSQQLPRTTQQKECSSPLVIQRWIKLAKGTGDDPSRYGRPDYSPPLSFDYTYFDPPEEKGGKSWGKPKEEKFQLLTDFNDTKVKVELALHFLFGGDINIVQVEPLLKTWMGYVKPDLRKDKEISPYVEGDVLKEITQTPLQYDIRKKAEVQAEFRYYHTYAELAWALVRDFEAQKALDLNAMIGSDSIEAELSVANKVLNSQWVNEQLQSLIIKIKPFAEKVATEKGYPTTLPLYAPLHGQWSYKDLIANLMKAASVADKISRLHDVKDYLLEAHAIKIDDPGFDLRINANRILHITKYNMRYNLGTPDEADEWVLFMREKKRPVWAGPSFTMIRLWRMAETVGATEEEKRALAYAMFAYWAEEYPLTSTPIHRFHEVMAASQKFNVQYDPNESVVENSRKAIPDLFQKAKL